MDLLVCTTNEGKRREFSHELKKHGINAIRIREKSIEPQASLEAVAMSSAAYLYAKYSRPLIVEDAGLFVDALRGFPGVYSAYAMKTIGYDGILKLLEGIENRRARFVSVIAYASAEGISLFKASTSGKIVEPRGSSGFGFDPIFMPDGSDKTFAEMSVEEKNRYSHRGKALRQFLRRLKEKSLRAFFPWIRYS